MLPGWAIAVTEPQAEAKAVANVGKLGHEVFYPKVIRRIRYRGKRIQVICPLFPGYFFAWLEPWSWRKLFDVRGIAGLFMQGEKVAIVQANEMQDLKNRCDRNGVYRETEPARLRVGQRVLVQSGVFTGKIGVFDGVRGQHEAVLVDLLGSQTRVLLKEGSLVAA